ncbi:hypothetical protein M8C21_032175 [Ambrosia artemisiifolia]|uniref:Uncharacterized protein n=1 Tax=Ambrosia artemisiifolia TaxID=4212 RepID=A0AAD5CRD4_AMBAR|nr:hypothetical protein M8C21_032175 [Ambrosia artemisiifolia]
MKASYNQGKPVKLRRRSRSRVFIASDDYRLLWQASDSRLAPADDDNDRKRSLDNPCVDMKVVRVSREIPGSPDDVSHSFSP